MKSPQYQEELDDMIDASKDKITQLRVDAGKAGKKKGRKYEKKEKEVEEEEKKLAALLEAKDAMEEAKVQAVAADAEVGQPYRHCCHCTNTVPSPFLPHGTRARVRPVAREAHWGSQRRISFLFWYAMSTHRD